MGIQKRKVAIIGAGVSGMTTATELMNSHVVHIYEATDSIGGRATTLLDNATQETIDNGQHICIGAYKYFFDLLKVIGGMEYFQIIEKYDIPYFYDGKFGSLTSKIFSGKFGLLEAIIRDKNFGFKEKINTIIFALKVQMDSISFQNYTDCYELLIRNNQSEKVIKILWEPLIVSTMNTPVRKASPLIFENIMLEGFLSKSQNAAFYLPKVHFGELFKGFESVFLKDGNKIYYTTPIKSITEEAGKYMVNEEYYDDVVITTPSFISKRILSELPIDIDVPDYSPIVSVYFWSDTKLTDAYMISTVDTGFDWLFNRDKLIDRKSDTYSYQITTSDAVRYAKLKDEVIISMMEEDLRKMFGEKFRITHYKIVRELMATFLADKKNNLKRPKVKTHLQGLYLAGDYSDNGYPSTLEGAAKNGFRAAHYILKRTVK
jgi:squalene-associated FAD-dependent desaturase